MVCWQLVKGLEICRTPRHQSLPVGELHCLPQALCPIIWQRVGLAIHLVMVEEVFSLSVSQSAKKFRRLIQKILDVRLIVSDILRPREEGPEMLVWSVEKSRAPERSGPEIEGTEQASIGDYVPVFKWVIRTAENFSPGCTMFSEGQKIVRVFSNKLELFL